MKYSTEEKKLWETQYQSGKNVPTISSEKNVSETTIYSHLKKSNVKTRSNAGRQRKYSCNDEYFSKIDTPNKAYWLGLITADGWVKKNNNVLGLGLKHGDKLHIKKFRKDIEAENPVKTQNSGLSTIQISSSRLREDLKKFGVIPNKTHNITPANIEQSLENHYWRGVVDGDGRVAAAKNRHGYEKARIELYGNYQMVQGFSEYIRSFCETKAKPDQKDKNVWRIGYTNQIASDIIKKLYDNENRALQRKEKAAQKALEKQSVNHAGGKDKKYKELAEKWNYLYHQQNYSYRKISREYNCSDTTVRKYISNDYDELSNPASN